MLPELVLVLAALYAGLAGSAHCVAMCGGIAAMAGSGVGRPLLQVPLANLGRILGYALAGAIGAGLFGQLSSLLPLEVARRVVMAAAAMVLILLGLRFLLGGSWGQGLERLGARFWQRLQPLSQKFLPLRRSRDALWLGMLWGWLPCGLVYMVLPMAWATGHALGGALVMLAFGLGTSPAMLAIGMGGAGLRSSLRRPAVQRLAGVLLLASGLLFLAMPGWMGSLHDGHDQAADQADHSHHGAGHHPSG